MVRDHYRQYPTCARLMVYSEPLVVMRRMQLAVSAYVSLKLIHIAAIVIWAAGLLYLPGLFAAHPGARNDEAAFRRLRRQTRIVYVALMSPAAVVGVTTGTALVFLAASISGWIVLKLIAVTGMVLLHVWMGRIMGLLLEQPAMHRPGTHLLLILPAAILIGLVITLVSWKPV
jgi:protoporphyrinogen IX oxidase